MSFQRSVSDQKLAEHTTVVDADFIEINASNLSADDVDKKHKTPPTKEIALSSDDEDSLDLTSDEFADIPELVRNIVSFEDDATLPVITFRSVLLSIVFCVLGSFVSQLA
ncbi:hypothetical protein N0V82_000026 [Gnomoniopsis sp. IMI 355080]|nr:hypothetical protein N0V82_000026 [Gnomoniopsis sp. IMI 355080]